MFSPSFDASKFLKGLNLADLRVRRGAARGVAKAMLKCEQHAKQDCPVETGTLAGTIHADVLNIKSTEASVSGVISAGGGEASDYAVYQHEHPLHHKFPFEGTYAAKYIEKPLIVLAPVCAGIIAAEIQRELAAGGSS